MGFLRRLKRWFFLFLFFVVLGFALVFYSLYEEDSYQKSCKELGLECSQGQVHGSVSKAQIWFEGLLKKFENLEIWKQIDATDEPKE